MYEGYPDRESPPNHIVTIEPHPQYPDDEEEEGEGQQVVGAEDYELEETESEISSSEVSFDFI